MKDAEISVIIPMYNAQETIIRALDSIKNQTYLCDYEIIIVNDGSTDDSKKVVEEYQKQNPKLNIILINQPNGGVSKARNQALKRATGDYIAFLDSDDQWLSGKIQRQMEIFKTYPQVRFLGTNRNGEIFASFLGKKFEVLTKIEYQMLLLKNFFPTPTVMMKTEMVKKVGFFEEQKRYLEDWEYWLRICEQDSCYLLNESWAITGGGKPHFGYSGLSSHLWEMEKSELNHIKKVFERGKINFFEYLIYTIYSFLKYIRRVMISLKYKKK